MLILSSSTIFLALVVFTSAISYVSIDSLSSIALILEKHSTLSLFNVNNLLFEVFLNEI